LTVLFIRDSFLEFSKVLFHSPPRHFLHLRFELSLITVTAQENDFTILGGGVALGLSQDRRESTAGRTPVRTEVNEQMRPATQEIANAPGLSRVVDALEVDRSAEQNFHSCESLS